MELTQEQIANILKESQAALVASTVESVRQNVNFVVAHNLDNLIAPIVKDFVEKELRPEIEVALFGAKGAIVEQVSVKAAEVGLAIATALANQVATNLGSYKRRDIITSLVK